MSYISIPKEIFGPAYNAVSAEAKLLYGLMLDRVSLSERNGEMWKIKGSGETFIFFSLAEICSTLGCGHDKASRLLRELSDVGLIRRIRQGLGRPDKLIVNTALLNAEKSHSKLRKSREPGCDISSANNTDLHHTDFNNPDLPHNQAALEYLIKENIDYDILISRTSRQFVDLSVSVILDAICNSNPTVKIAGISRAQREVYDRLTKLNAMHLQCVFESINSGDHEIHAIRPYVMTRLYYAESEIDMYYESKISADEKRNRR